MNVKSIVEEHWDGAQLKAVEHACPDAGLAFAALDRLDGKSRTFVEIRSNDDSILTIGGGRGKFVVCAAYEIDAELYTLLDPDRSARDCESLVVGGQLGSYPGDQVVSRDMAKEALSYLCEHGTISPHLCWQSE